MDVCPSEWGDAPWDRRCHEQSLVASVCKRQNCPVLEHNWLRSVLARRYPVWYTGVMEQISDKLLTLLWISKMRPDLVPVEKSAWSGGDYIAIAKLKNEEDLMIRHDFELLPEARQRLEKELEL